MNEHHYALISIENGTWQIVEHKPVPIATFTDESLAKACLELLNAQEPPALPAPQEQPPIEPDAPTQPAPAPPPPKSPKAPPKAPPWTAAENAVLRRHEFDTPRNYEAIRLALPDPSIRSAKGVSGRYARLAEKALRTAYAEERAAPSDPKDVTVCEPGPQVAAPAPKEEPAAVPADTSGRPVTEPERKEYQPPFTAALATPMARVRPPGPLAKTGPESGIEFNNFAANQPGVDK